MKFKMVMFKFAVKALVRPFAWANKQKKQTFITRGIRAAWRAL